MTEGTASMGTIRSRLDVAAAVELVELVVEERRVARPAVPSAVQRLHQILLLLRSAPCRQA